MNLKLLNYFVLLILILIYIQFIIFRPYEDDESLYILSGKAILEGKLNPLKIYYYGHYGNPFQQIIGSPLAPIIYGFGYMIGGIFLSRFFAMVFIILSLILVYKLTSKIGGNPIISLIFAGISSTTILLASDSLLDSTSVFFFILSLFLINKKMDLFAGISSGLAIISKFFAFAPVFFVVVYLLVKKKIRWKFLFGMIIVLLPFVILYRELIPTILNYLFVNKIKTVGYENIKNLLIYLTMFLPLASIICFVNIKSPIVKKYLIFFIPSVVVITFHLLTTNYLSFYRQIPFAEIPASILVGRILIKVDKKNLLPIIVFFVILNLPTASVGVWNYPSYNSIESKLSNVDGKILALNPHAFILSKGWDVYATAEKVFSYYYFEYEYNSTTLDRKSDMNDYETALKDNFFDYALISSYSPPVFPRYIQIENLVRKYYCPYLKQNKSNGIDIYKKCVS
jgi:hypothetical protein